MIIIQTVSKFNRFGIRKYSNIKSKTDKDLSYTVGKVRVKNKKHYKYVCTCPDYFYRQKKCKHIKSFISKERKIK